MSSTFLLYGATGYTGELIARAASQRGLHPILAGRSEHTLAPLAAELQLDYRVFSLDDPVALDAGLAEVTTVLNCAGPFTFTASRLAEACIRTQTHYLDLAGEVPEFQTLATRDTQAQTAGVMLLPGVGFGVVPSDCLALHLKSRLPSATTLSIAFHAIGGVSRGTLTTTLKDLPSPGVERREGKLIPIRAGRETRRIDFGQGPLQAVTNPWRGDIFTAYYSTNIPNIKTYTVYPGALRGLMRVSGLLKGVLNSNGFQTFLKRQMQNQPAGPSEQERIHGSTVLWGEVTNPYGQKAVSRLVGPEAYNFTVMTALAIVERVLEGHIQPGFHTPAQVYGADFVVNMPNVKLIDEA